MVMRYERGRTLPASTSSANPLRSIEEAFVRRVMDPAAQRAA